MPNIVDLISCHSDRVAPDACLGDVAALMLASRISSVIVVEAGRATGIITEHDILRLKRRHHSPEQAVTAAMSTPIHCVAADTPFLDAYRSAASLGIRHIIVNDTAGHPLGVVSEADFRRYLGPDFFLHLNDVDSLMERQFPRLPADAHLDEALAAMEVVRGSCVLVTDGPTPLGIVTERDVVRLFAEACDNPTLGSIMTHPPVCIRPEASLAEAAQSMQTHGIRHLAVTDSGNRLVGLLSEHALMRPLKLELIDDALAECQDLTRQQAAARTAAAHQALFQRTLLDTFPYPVWLKDTASRFLAVNGACAAAAGKLPADMVGKTDLDFWPTQLAERYRADDRAVMATRRNKVVTEPIAFRHGLVWHDTYKAPVIDKEGSLLGTVGFAHDISARRRVEEATLLRNAALAGLIRNEPLAGVLELIVLSVETEMPAWTCAIHLLDAEAQHLTLCAAPRLPDTYAEAVRRIHVAPGAGSCGSAAFLRQRVLVENIASHPYCASDRAPALEAGFAACWAEPILSPHGELLGTFSAHCRHPGVPSDDQLALLTQSGQLTALILAHQRGGEKLQASLDTFHGIFDSVSEALFIQAPDGTFLDVNRSAETLTGLPREQLIGRTHAEFCAEGLNDRERVVRHLQAATQGTPQFFELWVIDSARNTFPVEIRLHPCRYFGQEAVIASVIDVSDRKHAALRLEIEHDLAQALAAGLQRNDVLDTILHAALRFPDLDAGCIFQRDAEGTYRLVAHEGLSANFVHEHCILPPDSVHADGIRAGHLTCSCADPGEHCTDSTPLTEPHMVSEGLNCLTILPVVLAGEAIAALYLGGRSTRQVSAETLHALETLASHFAQTLFRLDAQEESARLQHNLGGLFNTLTDFIFVFDQHDRILHHNLAVSEQLGYHPGSLLGQHMAMVHPPESREMVMHHLGEIHQNLRGDCQLPLLHANGQPIMVETRIVRGYWDGKPALISVSQDIRERLMAEERQKLAASVFENAHEGIMITDPRGRIIEVNGTFSELTGYARHEAIGQTADLLKSGHHDSAFYLDMWRTIRDQGYWRGEVWNRKKTGEIFAELLTISTVRDRHGDISHFVGIFSDITLLKEHQKRLEHLAHFDALTQLPNRMLLADRMQLAMAQTERTSKTLAVCYLDLDGFKPVNDCYGHAIGDRLLIDVAHRLKACVRAGDTVSRLGGDEFVLLFSNLDDLHECDRAVGRVIHQLSAPFRLAGHDIAISASIGVTLYPQDGSDSDTLLRHADQAMYAAKQAGRNRYHLFDPEHDRRARVRHNEIERIREGLSQGEFVLHYQPKVNMRLGTVTGAEALIRWQHPERGLLPPAEFLPAVEGNDLSINLGDWVLQEALGQIGRWQQTGLDLAVSVNIAGNHLQSDGFARRLGELLRAHPAVPPSRLELEVLETAALEDLANVADLFEECRRLGVKFSLDDFGTGYSSLTYFRRLPADTLKIDQSFVRDMLDDPDDLAIVEGVIGLTQAFQRDVIAEGVESVEHGMVLLQLGCDVAQGYGIARPMPADAVAPWVATFKPDPLWNAIGSFRWSREDLPMLIADVEHKRWMQKLKACLAAPHGTQPVPSHDPRQSRFGRWFHSQYSARYRHLPDFDALGKAHTRLHLLGRHLLAEHANPASPSPRAHWLAELETLAEQFSRHIQSIQTDILLSAHTSK